MTFNTILQELTGDIPACGQKRIHYQNIGNWNPLGLPDEIILHESGTRLRIRGARPVYRRFG